MHCSTPGSPVLHYLLGFAQTRALWVRDATQPSHPLLLPSPALNHSQHWVFFPQWVTPLIRWPKYWSFSVSPSNEYSRLISFRNHLVLRCFVMVAWAKTKGLFKKLFLMWTVFKVFTEFVTTLLLVLNVFVFWPQSTWPLTRGRTHNPCNRRQSLNHWTTRAVPRQRVLISSCDNVYRRAHTTGVRNWSE